MSLFGKKAGRDAGKRRAAVEVERMHEHEPTAVAVRGPSEVAPAEAGERLRALEQTLGALLHRNAGTPYASELPPVNVVLPPRETCPVCGGKGYLPYPPEKRALAVERELARLRERDRSNLHVPEGHGLCGPCEGRGLARDERREVVLRMVRA